MLDVDLKSGELKVESQCPYRYVITKEHSLPVAARSCWDMNVLTKEIKRLGINPDEYSSVRNLIKWLQDEARPYINRCVSTFPTKTGQ